MKQVSVVIPTRDQADLLRACLRALREQTLDRSACEIIVVDDGSTDHTPEVVRDAGVLGVRFPVSRGRSAARNAGIERASTPLILFVDSDVIVRPEFLARHLEVHQRYGPGTLSRGPVIAVSDLATAQTAPLPRLLFSPAFLDTANACLEKHALQAAGMFDEGFTEYGWEDLELGLRLRRVGIRRIFCREAAAFHIQPPAHHGALTSLTQKEDERARSAVYFFRKHPTFETRMFIQATAVHRFLYWLQTGGGRLTAGNVTTLVRRLSQAGLSGPAYVLLRGVLNRHYLQTLHGELNRYASEA